MLREGNVIILANTTLEVAEACSGIRSLVSLLTLGIVYGYFTDRRTWMRWAIALATVPIAIVTNGMRVAGTGHRRALLWAGGRARGSSTTFSGWLVFVAAFATAVRGHARCSAWFRSGRRRTVPQPRSCLRVA